MSSQPPRRMLLDMRIDIGSSRVRQTILAGVFLSSIALSGGIAQAEGMLQIPGTDGIIHACFTREEGSLRVVDPNVRQCKREETALQWNQTGPQGPKGDPGAPAQPGAPGQQGAIGPQGTAGVSGYQQVTQSIDNFTVAAGTESVHVVTCPEGKKVLGGGFLLFNAGGFLSNNSNGPASDTQWGVSVYNPSSSSVSIGTATFYAVCAVAN